MSETHKSKPGMRNKRFQGKVVIVTGGNAGIGLVASVAFADEGAAVVIAARRTAEGEHAAQQIRDAGGEAMFVETDVSDALSVKAMVAATISRYGRLDVAFNNAGITGPATSNIADTAEEDYDRVFAINAKGTWLCMKYQIPEMLKTGGGAIINHSSRSGHRGGTGASAYYGSKHAVIGLTRAAALEYGGQGIRVNAIMPSFIDSGLLERSYENFAREKDSFLSRTPMKRAGTSQEVADTVLWLASQESSFINGVSLPIDGGATV